MSNLDDSVVKSLGLEWNKFDQRETDLYELEASFNGYIAAIPAPSPLRIARWNLIGQPGG
jgi:hypothetical protein